MSDDEVLHKLESFEQQFVLFQKQMLMEFQLVRTDMKTLRESLEAKIDVGLKTVRQDIRALRLTTADGLASVDKRMEILRGRVDRIERHLRL